MIKTFICRVCNKQVTEDRSLFVARYVCEDCTRKWDEGTVDDNEADDAMPLILPTSILGAVEAIVAEDVLPDIIAPADITPDTTPSSDPSPEVSDPGTSFDY